MTGIRPDYHRPSSRCHSRTIDSRVGKAVTTADTGTPVSQETGPTDEDLRLDDLERTIRAGVAHTLSVGEWSLWRHPFNPLQGPNRWWLAGEFDFCGEGTELLATAFLELVAPSSQDGYSAKRGVDSERDSP